MEKGYRAFTIRRLFKEDIPMIEKCYRDFDFLHFNPVDTAFVEKVMLCGSFWGVFAEDEIVAVTYMLPAESTAFSQLNASWEIQDLLNTALDSYMLCGYVWVAGEYKEFDMYSALCRLWAIQAAKREKSRLLHYMPAHVKIDMQRLFYNSFDLVGLRGLDNLVPHYIFIKEVQLKDNDVKIYEDIKSCLLTDTKTISMLCEHGYKGFDIDRQKNLLFRR